MGRSCPLPNPQLWALRWVKAGLEPWGVQVNQTPHNAYPRPLGRRQGLGSTAKDRSRGWDASPGHSAARFSHL